MTRLTSILTPVAFLILLSCSKGSNKSYIRYFPPLFLNIVDSNHPVDFFAIQLYWFENGTKKYREGGDSTRVIYPPISYDTVREDYVRDSLRPLFCSYEFFRIATDRGIRTFYLDYGNGDVDTLALKITYVADENGNYTSRSIANKGVILPIDSSFAYANFPQVHLLKRN